MYGGKIMFVLGAGWLVVWSVVAGVAKNEITLDLARAFAGLGPAAFLPSSIMLLGSVYRPGPRKNLVGLLSYFLQFFISKKKKFQIWFYFVFFIFLFFFFFFFFFSLPSGRDYLRSFLRALIWAVKRYNAPTYRKGTFR